MFMCNVHVTTTTCPDGVHLSARGGHIHPRNPVNREKKSVEGKFLLSSQVKGVLHRQYATVHVGLLSSDCCPCTNWRTLCYHDTILPKRGSILKTQGSQK